MDLRHTGDLRCRLRDAIRIIAGDKSVHFTQLRRRRHRCEGGVLDVTAVMFDEDKNAHFAIPRPLSRSTSSSTLPTLMPAWRLAGSVTLIVSSRRATSTP